MAEWQDRVEANPDTAYEPSDWWLGTIGLVLLSAFILLVVSALVLMWVYPRAVSDANRQLRVTPPAPRLQIDPAQDLARFRAAEERRLDTYYWIDKQKGIVHIPIEAAMKKLAAQGIPGFPKAAK